MQEKFPELIVSSLPPLPACVVYVCQYYAIWHSPVILDFNTYNSQSAWYWLMTPIISDRCLWKSDLLFFLELTAGEPHHFWETANITRKRQRCWPFLIMWAFLHDWWCKVMRLTNWSRMGGCVLKCKIDLTALPIIFLCPVTTISCKANVCGHISKMLFLDVCCAEGTQASVAVLNYFTNVHFLWWPPIQTLKYWRSSPLGPSFMFSLPSTLGQES